MDKLLSNIDFDPLKLETALAEAGVSQATLAKAIGWKHRNVANRVIRGVRSLTATELLRISEYLQMRPSDFAKNN